MRGKKNIAEPKFRADARTATRPRPGWSRRRHGGTAATIGRYLRYRKLSTSLCVADPESSVFHRHYAERSVRRVERCDSVIEGIGRTTVAVEALLQRMEETLPFRSG